LPESREQGGTNFSSRLENFEAKIWKFEIRHSTPIAKFDAFDGSD
jgi:hypothetical protein